MIRAEYARFFAATLALVVLVMPFSARATLIISGGTSGVISSAASNDFFPLFELPATSSLSGVYGANIFSTAGTEIRIDIFGAEAGFKNSFLYDNSVLYQHPGGGAVTSSDLGSPLATFYETAGVGSLDFSFGINSVTPSLLNGFNPDSIAGGVGPNFFSSRAGGGSNVVYLFLDDGGGGNDSDYDDLLVRIIEVPEPASFGALGLGLAGLGFFMQRQRRAT